MKRDILIDYLSAYAGGDHPGGAESSTARTALSPSPLGSSASKVMPHISSRPPHELFPASWTATTEDARLPPTERVQMHFASARKASTAVPTQSVWMQLVHSTAAEFVRGRREITLFVHDTVGDAAQFRDTVTTHVLGPWTLAPLNLESSHP